MSNPLSDENEHPGRAPIAGADTPHLSSNSSSKVMFVDDPDEIFLEPTPLVKSNKDSGAPRQFLSSINNASSPRSPSRKNSVFSTSRKESSLRMHRQKSYTSFFAFKSDDRPRTMLQPTVGRHIELPKLRTLGIVRGLFEIVRCNPVHVKEDSIDQEVPHGIVSVLPPLWILFFLFLVLLYCTICLFILPEEALPPTFYIPSWHGGDMSLVEFALPALTFILCVGSLAYARALGISLENYETHHAMHPRLVKALENTTLVLSRDGVQRLEKVNNYGVNVSKRVLQLLRRTGFAGRPDLVTCDVYAKYLCSMASIHALRHFKRGTVIYSFVAPLFIAVGPVIPRLVYGGSLWADGRFEAFLLAFLGPFVSYCSLRLLCRILAVHSETLVYQRERIRYLTLSLPDPGGNTKDWEHWPQVDFDSLINIMTWHRLRWALSVPPVALNHWGSRIFETICLACFLQIVLAVAWVLSNGRDAVLLDPIVATTVLLLFFAFPLVLYILNFALNTNMLLESHVLAICRIMLFSMRNDTHGETISALANNNSTSVSKGEKAVQEAYENFDKEKSGKMREIRHILRDLASALPLQTKYLTFFGIRVFPAPFAAVFVLMFITLGLFLLRFFFGVVLQ